MKRRVLSSRTFCMSDIKQADTEKKVETKPEKVELAIDKDALKKIKLVAAENA